MPDQPRLIAAPAAATDPEADTRRAEYHERLRAALQDPAFRAAEGFPIADDEAILALSDPPYYTACPNPFLPEILEEWRMANDELRMQNCETASTDSPFAIRHSQIRHSYHREPFAADVSEGKNDPIYNAHSYHTKVPHKAIMRYILHYTEPGDVVFDGFCGTGMTGVAAQLCGDRKAVESLGYFVDDEGNIFDAPPDPKSEIQNPKSKIGARRAVLVDLSPAATFIAYNYNTPVDVAAFEREAQRILREVEAECGWMYETWHVFPHPLAPSPKAGEGEQDPHPLTPSPTWGEGGEELPSPSVGEGLGVGEERWHIPESLRRRMVELARQFRKAPTPSEAILWQALRGKKLDGVKFRRQQPIGPFVVDFYASSQRLIVEVDGPIHDFQREHDAERQRLLESLGLRFVRISAHLVETDLPRALNLIRAAFVPHPLAPSPTTGEGEQKLPTPSVGEGVGVGVKGRIRYTVWSEVFLCPQCSGEVVFLDEALDPETQRVRESFPCPHCGADMSKRALDKCRVKVYDAVLGRTVETLKRRPVLLEYEVGRARYTKRPDAADLELLEQIEALPFPADFPASELPYMHMTHQRMRIANYGVTHLHHFFFPRARQALRALWTKTQAIPDSRLRAMLIFAVEQTIWGMSLLNRYGPTHFSQVNRYLSGVYYISSLISEVAPWYILDGKMARLGKAFAGLSHTSASAAISTQSAAAPTLPAASVDYIFTDPPFGENIYYADLNYLVESWHGVKTNSAPEAIIDKAKRKSLRDYQDLMRGAFREYYRILKPGRWMTVEFHNSHNAVWNAIQEALLSAGFVVADVRTLDKKSASYRQVTAASAAKQDLIISAYKPNDGLEERFRLSAGTPDGAWDFVRQHLGRLPVVVTRADGALEILAERQPFLLFDRMVAFHIQRGAAVPLSAAAFYQGLRERFIERDGMVFLPEQVPAYDRARLEAQSVAQLTFLVSDEKTALQWLRQQLNPALGGQPQSYQQLQPQFLKQLHQAKHEALPELNVLLEQNFIPDEVGLWRVPDPAKAADLETLRRKALLREFAIYLGDTKRLRQFRTEAIRTGFADAWQRKDYPAIIQVAERLPESVLQEDPELLMYYDNATLRVGAQA